MSSIKVNLKKAYVKGLFTSMKADSNPNARLTFLTNFGFIEGAEASIQRYDVDKGEEFVEQLQLAKEQHGEIKFRDLAISMVDNTTKEEESIEESNVMIYLEDVKIIHNNNTIHMAEFTLFLDQVIGVIPGTINVK
ncbi:hypothetical protein [Bacillus paramycoides]|uniref:hypothetical protein n=1 Tax=Bacillus paramycoides TaxID=2026194 RepID=UPI002E1D4300|nr:hypothetical protein [Bacillus paramycoides]